MTLKLSSSKPILLVGGPLRGMDYSLPEFILDHFEILAPRGVGDLSVAELDQFLTNAHCFIAGSETLNAKVIRASSKLRLIARLGSGLDSVDWDAAFRENIVVSRVPGGNSDSVAEHVLALMFSLSRRIVFCDREVRSGLWDRTQIQSIRGKRVAIIGLGHAGQAIARICARVGMNITGYSRSYKAEFQTLDNFTHTIHLRDALSDADFVVPALALNHSTRYFCNHEFFSNCKKGAFFINITRGDLVDLESLVGNLRTGQIGGAGIDVFSVEPPLVSHDIFKEKNVVFSPHVAGNDEGALGNVIEKALFTITELYQGRWPRDLIVNPDQYCNKWRWTN